MSGAPARTIAVSCRGVTKTYGAGHAKVAALRGVDLQIRSGELCMIVGPSGCGKTTLLSVMTGILDPDDGCCEVFGQDPRRMSGNERIRFRGRNIGFVFQLFNLLPALTASENVAVPLLLNGRPRREALARAQRALEEVGLGGRPRALPGELSGGQQQRVAIARAMVHEPVLIVCDEPTSNLDHETSEAMIALLRSVARSPGRALVVVTHDTRILGFADRIAHMDDGRITNLSAAQRVEEPA